MTRNDFRFRSDGRRGVSVLRKGRAKPIKSLKAKPLAVGNADGQRQPHKTRVLRKTSILRSEDERCE